MIGIFGGTFDPVHLGHIKPAIDVMDRLDLDELRFVPCSIPAHRSLPVASTTQRLMMLHAAIEGHTRCVIDERELNRDGTSYMIDTLKSLQADFKDQSLCLIIGMDAFYSLHQWKQWQAIFDVANCIVTYRPGSELNEDTMHPDLVAMVKKCEVDSVDDFINKSSIEQTRGALLFMSVTQLDISATNIRERIKQQQPINELVPTAVNSIIQQQQIYIG